MHDVSTLLKKYPLNPAPGLVGINIMNKQLQQYHRYLSMPLTHTWPNPKSDCHMLFRLAFSLICLCTTFLYLTFFSITGIL